MAIWQPPEAAPPAPEPTSTKLVIISGSEAIAKKLIAHQIQAKLNDWSVPEGYSVDVTQDPWVIYDPDGNDITTDVDGPWFSSENYTDEEILSHHAIYDKLIALEENFRTQKFENHYNNKFCSVAYDLVNHVLDLDLSDDDLAQVVVPWDSSTETNPTVLHYDSEFSDIVSKYNACTDDYQVITGAFGIEFIHRMRAEIGAENVIAINITRNPSVSFALHQRIPNFTNDQVDMSDELHIEKYREALMNSAILKQDSSITTIKFEDMIASESLMIDGTDVGVYLDFNAANSWLTQFENNAIINNVPTTAQQVTDWNALAAAFTMTSIDPDDTWITEQMGTPWNLFEKLGYDPLTLAEIRAS
jgi:hypothetical protein